MLPPFENWNGAAMSSSPWEWLWNGDEEVATPFLAGAVSRCALCAGAPSRGDCVQRRRRRQEAKVWVWELETGSL
jgi:hypothetical protein